MVRIRNEYYTPGRELEGASVAGVIDELAAGDDNDGNVTCGDSGGEASPETVTMTH